MRKKYISKKQHTDTFRAKARKRDNRVKCFLMDVVNGTIRNWGALA